jgi:hypothetical protein
MQHAEQTYGLDYDAETVAVPDGPPILLRRQHGRHSWLEELASDVRGGLTGHPKELPPKYFYDSRGSALFDEISWRNLWARLRWLSSAPEAPTRPGCSWTRCGPAARQPGSDPSM